MHIRHCILMGVLGAAIFLPAHAFAGKNEAAAEPGNARVTEVHTQANEKNPKIEPRSKAVPEVPEPVRKRVKKEVPKPEPGRAKHEDAKEKNVPPANGHNPQNDKSAGPQTHKRKGVRVSKSSVNAADKKKSVRKVQQTEPKQKRELASNLTKKKRIVEPAKPEREKEVLLQKQQETSFVLLESDQFSQVKKNTAPRTPSHQEGRGTSPEKREIPGEVEAVNNAPQRLPSSGGHSQETVSQGTGMVSFIHHPADWDIGLKLRTIYHSREDTYCYQWINAPPSPPPKAAPFIY
ncbi:hypothetical protein GA0061094_0545 [[Bacillus] enclensis]|uniref:Uncharacterized protein n=1 Tax=[Bacillus] enclensis TaxID=1402860 RepID=A0A1C3ZAV9_9BACI|nr:hypothetical protein [[Bacillus] enclensis]SCB79537.1 hypothetical protein GA0061094_0545 [[Bacillus] enclensis]